MDAENNSNFYVHASTGNIDDDATLKVGYDDNLAAPKGSAATVAVSSSIEGSISVSGREDDFRPKFSSADCHFFPALSVFHTTEDGIKRGIIKVAAPFGVSGYGVTVASNKTDLVVRFSWPKDFATINELDIRHGTPPSKEQIADANAYLKQAKTYIAGSQQVAINEQPSSTVRFPTNSAIDSSSLSVNELGMADGPLKGLMILFSFTEQLLPSAKKARTF